MITYVKIILDKKDLPTLNRQMMFLVAALSGYLKEMDGITRMLYKTELDKLQADLMSKYFTTQHSDKKTVTLKLRAPASYVLYQLIGQLPDTALEDPMLMRSILASIDQVAVSWKSVGQ